jgi:GT2 family glycosyltransferase
MGAKLEKPLISFIVSACNRPMALRCCLASLALQQGGPYQVVVTDNSEVCGNWQEVSPTFDRLGFIYFPTQEKTCYRAANYAMREAAAAALAEAPVDQVADWLCFPSDDSYYVPSFARLMLAAAKPGVDLVYCDWLDTRLQPHYERFKAAPRTGAIDKTAFIVRRDVFLSLGGFMDPDHEFGDGHFVDAVVRSGAVCAKAEGILLVHN